MYKVLIVDSETGMKTLLQEIFNGQEILFTQVTTARDALKIKDVDLIILDTLIDGDTSGLQLINKYRKQVQTKETPLVVITRKDTLNDRALAMEAGASAYVIRPFDIKQLSEDIFKLIESNDKKTNF